MKPYIASEKLDIIFQIITTMSYSTVKKNGFPSLNEYQLAYHIVREADLLAAYDIDWFNPSATLIEHYKYTNDKNISVTQDEHLSFLLSKFETSDIKTAFADTVGKLGKPARDAFYPLPLRRDKVIRNFLLLIYDGRSIIVDDSKDGFR